MDSDRSHAERAPSIQRIPLQRSRRRLSFEWRVRIFLLLLGVPGLLLLSWLVRLHAAGIAILLILAGFYALGWLLAISILLERIIHPLQILTNVIAALREDDYSFRARGAQRNDAVGDLAFEINALAKQLQSERAGALEAIALVERVVDAMHSPVLAFDQEGRLKLLNSAAEKVLGLEGRAMGRGAADLGLDQFIHAADEDLLTLETSGQPARWMVRRTRFRLNGVPHELIVLADVSAALREEERLAWRRLIRVLGHEINNSLTPIKSIASSLRVQVGRQVSASGQEDFDRGLEVIESRAESLNRFLQAYRQLTGLPAPTLAPLRLGLLIRHIADLEIRLRVKVVQGEDILIYGDADQLQQALINLVRNAVEAASGPEGEDVRTAEVTVGWQRQDGDAVISVTDNGPGVSNESNLFVPFYTTKPSGTGIGLVLAQQIVEGHAGSVKLTNRIDGVHGCVAEIRLPLDSSTRLPLQSQVSSIGN